MMNLRALAESDLALTLEGDFSSTITVINPNGAKQSLQARVRWSSPRVDSKTGIAVVFPDPVVEVRQSSLTIGVPKTGENWAVVIPDGPRSDAKKVWCVLDKDRAVDGGSTLGIIRLSLTYAEKAGS